MKDPRFRLKMSRMNWWQLSLLVLSLDDVQTNKGHRILTIRELLLLKEIGGDMMMNLMYQCEGPLLPVVPLSALKMEVLLKVIRWYEDNLLATKNLIINRFGESELINRYERLTEITRAIQTAAQINSDQFDR